MSEANKQVVRRLYDEVFGKGAIEVVDEIVSPDAVDHSPPLLPVDDGREGRKELTRQLRAAFPDLRMDVNHMVAEGDLVAVHFTMHGTHRGDVFGVPATGKHVAMDGFDLIRMQDGLCTEYWGVQDNAGMMRQLHG